MIYECPECEDAGVVEGAQLYALTTGRLKCGVCAGDNGRDVFVRVARAAPGPASDDITVWLRAHEDQGCHEAADEIERLRGLVDEMADERDQVAMLVPIGLSCLKPLDGITEHITRLRAENERLRRGAQQTLDFLGIALAAMERHDAEGGSHDHPAGRCLTDFASEREIARHALGTGESTRISEAIHHWRERCECGCIHCDALDNALRGG